MLMSSSVGMVGHFLTNQCNKTFQEKHTNVSDTLPAVSRRFEPAGHPHFWCDLVGALCKKKKKERKEKNKTKQKNTAIFHCVFAQIQWCLLSSKGKFSVSCSKYANLFVFNLHILLDFVETVWVSSEAKWNHTGVTVIQKLACSCFFWPACEVWIKRDALVNSLTKRRRSLMSWHSVISISSAMTLLVEICGVTPVTKVNTPSNSKWMRRIDTLLEGSSYWRAHKRHWHAFELKVPKNQSQNFTGVPWPPWF